MAERTSSRRKVAPTVDMVDLITRKRDGGTLDADVIALLMSDYVAGRVPDYQMSALLMAIVWRGLDPGETLALTRAMVSSGEVLEPGRRLGRRIVDKHSTGGVGDKVSLALAPIVAACGVPFGKMSGRGLGHTGGTLDKLESIPGFRVELDRATFLRQVAQVGVAIAGQTGDLVPADRMLYELRDVTGTVESIPLIAASIMSKKIACGADAIVLDVKVGSGAFMKRIEDARALADEMIEIGRGAGRDVKVFITDMSRPLGCAIGNAVEIREVVAMLRGGGPPDLRELVLAAAGALLALSDLDMDEAVGRAAADDAVVSGRAWQRWEQWIRAQGGNPGAELQLAPVEHTVLAHTGGVVTEIDALTAGLAAARMGAGRRRKGDSVDHGVGILLHTEVGAAIGSGDPLFTVYARSEDAGHDAAASLLGAIRIAPAVTTRVGRRPIVLERRG